MPEYRSQIGSVPFLPPAPVVELEITSESSGATLEALVDSGADSTCIPERVAAALELQPVSALLVGGADGRSENRLVYRAYSINFNGISLVNFAVIGMPIEYGIVGRDLMNKFMFRLNGPSLLFTIE